MCDKETNEANSIQQVAGKVRNINWSNLTKIPSCPYPPIDYTKLEDIDPIPIREHMEAMENYQARSLEVLQAIEENTANLYTLVELINKSNDMQDDLLAILSEVMEIAKAKDKNDADSRYEKVMKKMTTLFKAGEVLSNFTGIAKFIYDIVIAIIQQ